MSPIPCILHGKSSACWSIVRTRALLSNHSSRSLGTNAGRLAHPGITSLSFTWVKGRLTHQMPAAAVLSLNLLSRARAPGRNALPAYLISWATPQVPAVSFTTNAWLLPELSPYDPTATQLPAEVQETDAVPASLRGRAS